IGLPKAVIYIDLSLNIIQRRIFQRGRQYEIDMDINYFKEYNDKVKEYFKKHSHTKNYFFNVDDLVLDPDDKKLNQIKEMIDQVIN
ncbi:MAG: deoxynucleoside kinase, partial [Methanoregula sp.]|nr:deoxynucleoside kinase [Methanoregula sp.]